MQVSSKSQRPGLPAGSNRHPPRPDYCAEGATLRSEPFIFLGNSDGTCAGFVHPTAVTCIRYDCARRLTLVDLWSGQTLEVQGDIAWELLSALREDASDLPEGFIDIYADPWKDMPRPPSPKPSPSLPSVAGGTP